jgi:Na+/glutamate symporter
MNGAVIASAAFGILAGSLIGALVAAWENREYYDIPVILNWIGGLATVSHAIALFGV